MFLLISPNRHSHTLIGTQTLLRTEQINHHNKPRSKSSRRPWYGIVNGLALQTESESEKEKYNAAGGPGENKSTKFKTKQHQAHTLSERSVLVFVYRVTPAQAADIFDFYRSPSVATQPSESERAEQNNNIAPNILPMNSVRLFSCTLLVWLMARPSRLFRGHLPSAGASM